VISSLKNIKSGQIRPVACEAECAA